MASKETNEAFMERIIEEIDMWQEGKEALLGGGRSSRLPGRRSGQEGNRKHRAAMVVFMDENGKNRFQAFSDNKGKHPWLRFIGIMSGGLASCETLYNSAVLMVKFATKIRNRKEKENATDK